MEMISSSSTSDISSPTALSRHRYASSYAATTFVSVLGALQRCLVVISLFGANHIDWSSSSSSNEGDGGGGDASSASTPSSSSSLLPRYYAADASTQLKLIQDMLESYDRKAKPTWDNDRPVNVTFSMDLYQILELNEPQQYILLNAWIIERWHDEFLYWDPRDYDNITELRLPYDVIWLPDTTLYNSLVMKDDDTRRLLNAKLTTNVTRKAVLIELLYPTIYKFSCLLTLVCTMTFSSWTYDQKGIDYLPYSESIGISNFLENEGWYLLRTAVRRKEVKYSCCPNKYTLIKLTLYLRRKPLFYLINLIIPTSIITLIAIVGFFTTSSASGMREEKVSLGITTLLSMSILMLMVSDQMPTTSTFIPLIGWFILGTIVVISIGTLASSVVIAVQKRGRLGERLSERAIRVVVVFATLSLTDIPLHLQKAERKRQQNQQQQKSASTVRRQSSAYAYGKEDKDQPQPPSTANGISPSSKASFACRRHHYHQHDHHRRHHQALSGNALLRRVGRVLGFFRRRDNGVDDGGSESDGRTAATATEGGVAFGADRSTDRLVAHSASGGAFSNRNGNRVRTSLTYSAVSSDREESVTDLPPRPQMSPLSIPFSPDSTASSAFPQPPPQPRNGVAIQRLSLTSTNADDEEEDDVASEDGEALGSVRASDHFASAVFAASGRPEPAAAIITPRSARNEMTTARREKMFQHTRVLNENLRANRLLAQKEYEWVATVLERCFFVIFVIIFFILTFGINLIGYLHWSDVNAVLSREGDERH